MSKKSIIIFISTLCILGILLYIFYPVIQSSAYLTPKQGQEMYDKGYSDGNQAEELQLSQIEYYRGIVDDCNRELIRLNVLLQENESLQNQVISLTILIEQCESKISYYEDLLENLGFDGSKVTFYIDNNIYTICFVETNEVFSETIVPPIKEGFEFLGWTLDGINIVDINQLNITSDVSIFALFSDIRTWNVLYEYNDNEVGHLGYYFNTTNATEFYFNVADLETTDIFRVTFSSLGYYASDIFSVYEYYFIHTNNDSIGQTSTSAWNSNDRNKYIFVVENDSSLNFEFSGDIFSYDVACVEDGIIRIRFNYSSSFGGFIRSNGIEVSKVEVYSVASVVL